MILTLVLMRFLRVFDFQVNYMLYWRFYFEKGIPINCSFTHYELGHIYWISLKMKCTQYGIYEQTAFNPGEGQHAWRTNWVLKDNLSEGQHHGIEEIILKMGDIGEERRLGRDARTVWAGKRKVSGWLWWWWAPSTSVALDITRWGSFSVRPLLAT